MTTSRLPENVNDAIKMLEGVGYLAERTRGARWKITKPGERTIWLHGVTPKLTSAEARGIKSVVDGVQRARQDAPANGRNRTPAVMDEVPESLFEEPKTLDEDAIGAWVNQTETLFGEAQRELDNIEAALKWHRDEIAFLEELRQDQLGKLAPVGRLLRTLGLDRSVAN